MFEFVFRNCRSFREPVVALTRYAKDMALMARMFEVGVAMDYSKQRDELKFTCRGRSENVVATATIFCSIMSAAIILGGNQDGEWKPLMREAYSHMEADRETTARIMGEIAQIQLKLANSLRIQKAQERESRTRYNLHMEMGL